MKKIKMSHALVGFLALNMVLASHYSLSQSTHSSGLPKAEVKAKTRLNKLPDFTVYTDVKEKKSAFFETLYPIIEEENRHVLRLRKVIQTLKGAPELTEPQTEWLSTIATHYKVDETLPTDEMFTMLLRKVDFVPPSLALTQAAIESGWGSSRFARKGNNLFGQWCFTKGCGIVPSSRDSGKGHEVAKFSTVNAAVRAYIKNLNTNAAYQELRTKRASLRKSDSPVSGIALASTLTRYSEEGTEYVQKVTRFIQQNNLQRFNEQFSQASLIAAR